jgi:hypothetical protein
MPEELTGFAKIKWDVAKIQQAYLGMNAEKTAIEANPSNHQIAKYIQANYTPKVNSAPSDPFPELLSRISTLFSEGKGNQEIAGVLREEWLISKK